MLNQLLCYTDIKGSCFFVVEIVESLNLNNEGRHDGFATVFHVLVDFKTKKLGWRSVIGSSTLKDKKTAKLLAFVSSNREYK